MLFPLQGDSPSLQKSGRVVDSLENTREMYYVYVNPTPSWRDSTVSFLGGPSLGRFGLSRVAISCRIRADFKRCRGRIFPTPSRVRFLHCERVEVRTASVNPLAIERSTWNAKRSASCRPAMSSDLGCILISRDERTDCSFAAAMWGDPCRR